MATILCFGLIAVISRSISNARIVLSSVVEQVCLELSSFGEFSRTVNLKSCILALLAPFGYTITCKVPISLDKGTPQKIPSVLSKRSQAGNAF